MTALALLVLGAASAQADNTFHCQASALRASIAGQATIEPVTIGTSGGCSTAQGTPTIAVPQLLTAQALIANSTYDAGAIAGTAEGGIAKAAVVPTPDQISQLPTEQAVSQLPNVTIPVPAPLQALGAPASLQVNIQDAVRALIPTPGTALLSAEVLDAKATIGCQGGAPVLDGSSQVAGVKLLGNDLTVTKAVDEALTLIDTQNIDPSQIDLSKIQVTPALNSFSQPVATALQALIAPALAALPKISLPASIATVKLVPNEQIRNGNSLVQRALHATITILGQPLLDAVFGEAMVSGSASNCAVAAQGGVADQILQCSDRKLVLIDVLPRGNRVKLLGYANRNYVGRRVAIRLRATGKVVAHALVRKNGSFATYAPAPPAAFLATHLRANSVRYRAEIGKELSLPLKLQRRLTVSSLTSRKGKVIVTGRVVPPLTTPVSEVRLVRRVSCHKVVLVKRFKPRPDGTFRVVVKAPKGQAAAIYRLVTRVREKPSNPRTYPTFTLPRGVALSTR